MEAGARQQMTRWGVLDVRDLTEQRLTHTALLLVVAATPLAVWYLPGSVFRWQRSLAFALVAAAGALAWALRRWNPVAGALALVLILLGLAAGAAVLIPGSAFAFLVLAVVAAGALPWPPAPLATGLASAALYTAAGALVPPQPYSDLVAFGLSLVGAILFLNARSGMVILRWSWRRHGETLRLAEELRDR